ncbi:MAG: Uma2 family endonuclease [Thermomicrobiales bacterium]
MALPRQFTVAELIAMPASERGERYELIDGDLYMTPAPTDWHQAINGNLNFSLEAHVRAQRLGVVRFNSAVRVGEGTYVIPDAMFLTWARRQEAGDDVEEAIPDLACEILSPRTRHRDLLTKRRLYERIGVREYWIIDPDAQTVVVLGKGPQGFTELAEMEPGVIPSRVLPELRLTLAELFEDVVAYADRGTPGEGME